MLYACSWPVYQTYSGMEVKNKHFSIKKKWKVLDLQAKIFWSAKLKLIFLFFHEFLNRCCSDNLWLEIFLPLAKETLSTYCKKIVSISLLENLKSFYWTKLSITSKYDEHWISCHFYLPNCLLNKYQWSKQKKLLNFLNERVYVFHLNFKYHLMANWTKTVFFFENPQITRNILDIAIYFCKDWSMLFFNQAILFGLIKGMKLNCCFRLQTILNLVLIEGAQKIWQA